jgi:hypothetical protein
MVVRGFYKFIWLLAAIALQQVHRVYGDCVASNGVFVHGGLLHYLSGLVPDHHYIPGMTFLSSPNM